MHAYKDKHQKLNKIASNEASMTDLSHFFKAISKRSRLSL